MGNLLPKIEGFLTNVGLAGGQSWLERMRKYYDIPEIPFDIG